MKLSTLVTRRFIGQQPPNIASYALKYENGAIKYHINDVCFARAIRRQFWNDDGTHEGPVPEFDCDIVAVAMSLRNAKKWGKENWSKERPITKLHRYTRYILNDSIFKDAFLTKNNSVAWANGVDINVDTNHSLCVAGMIALREGWEFPDFLDSWNATVKEGFHPTFAYVVAHMFKIQNDKVYAVGWGGHQTLDHISIEDVKALIKEGPLIVGESFRNSVDGYHIFRTLRSDFAFKRKGVPCISLRVRPEAIKKKQGDGWAATFYWDKKEFFNNLKALEQEVLA